MPWVLGIYALVLLGASLTLRRLRVLLICLGVGVAALAAFSGSLIRQKSKRPPLSYSYLRNCRLVPGLKAPVPPGVPLVWMRGQPARGRTSPTAPGSVLTSEHDSFEAPRYREWDEITRRNRSRTWNLELLEDDLTVDGGDVGRLRERARTGDIHALLALAIRKDPGSTGVFGSIRGGGQRHLLAIWYFYSIGDERATRMAIEALRCDDPVVRAYASTVLRHLGPQGLTGQLTPLLRDKDSGVVRAALEGVGADGDPSAFEQIVALLDRSDCSVESRKAAFRALGRTRQDRAIALVLAELEKPQSSSMMQYVAEGLVFPALREAGDTAIPVLQSFVSGERSVKGFGTSLVADALGATGSERAIKPLLELLAANRSEENVGRALAALGPQGEAILLELAKSDEMNEQICAAVGLGYSESPEAVGLLISLLDAPSIARIRAAESLGRLQARSAVEPLLGALQDRSESMRRAAAGALFMIGDAQAIAVLRRQEGKESSSPTASLKGYMKWMAETLEAHQHYLAECAGQTR